jgi:hypothetical protein
LVQLAIRHREEHHHNITAAVCFKTLFGGTNIDLGIVIQWAAYHRLLGFDHIFMWYRPEMISNPRFAELQSLPFVTLTVNTDGKRSNYYNQWEKEIECLSDRKFAQSYDWAMLADIDEYLRFKDDRPIGLKDFLHRYNNMTYLSFGKQMYTLDHRMDLAATNYVIDTSSNAMFAVADYPYHIKHFCYHTGKRLGDPICPTWRGRSKVIVRPVFHRRVDTHGMIHTPDPALGQIHFDPSVAHFMEWPDLFAPHNVTQQPDTPSRSFLVQEYEQVHIHNLKRAFRPVNDDDKGTKSYRVEYDADLRSWFEFVLQRGSSG